MWISVLNSYILYVSISLEYIGHYFKFLQVGHMIQAESDPARRDEYLKRLMDLPNQVVYFAVVSAVVLWLLLILFQSYLVICYTISSTWLYLLMTLMGVHKFCRNGLKSSDRQAKVLPS